MQHVTLKIPQCKVHGVLRAGAWFIEKREKAPSTRAHRHETSASGPARASFGWRKDPEMNWGGGGRAKKERKIH